MNRSTVLLCVLTAIVQNGASAQSLDSQELLRRVRANVTDALARLPKYMCSLTIERAQYAPDPKRAPSCPGLADQRDREQPKTPLAETDRLKLNVAIAANGEIYSWPDANRFDAHDPFDFVRTGATENGVYSSFLSAIFGGNDGSATEFSSTGTVDDNGRRLAEFAFRVPQEKSNYTVRIGSRGYKVSYVGTFLADPATADLVRLAIQSQGLPASSGACEVNTTLDYSRLRLAIAGDASRHLRDEEFLLPGKIQLDILKTDGSQNRNRAVYAGCREFVGESSIRFDPPPAAPDSAPVSTAPTVELPTGIRFKVRFTQPIDTTTASGGDTVKATLEGAIRDASSRKVLAGEGTEILARITRLEQIAGAKASIRMEVKLESVRVGGSLVALPAVARPGPDAEEAAVRPLASGGSAVHLGRTPEAMQKRVALGRLHTDSGTYVFEFPGEKQGFVIGAGLESSWVTGR
jgi:hypothetical protein